jgi:hypothetical protein
MSMKIAKNIIKGIGNALLFFVALGIALVVILLILHDQPLVLPPPTGNYAIGRTEFDWIDNNRMDLLSDKANEKRELLIWIWDTSTLTTCHYAGYRPHVFYSTG